MSKDKKTRGKPFQPGQSGNPNGRPKLPGDIKGARALNRIEFERILNQYLYCTPLQLAEKLQDPETAVIDGIVCKILLECGQKGDTLRFNFVIERLLGKVKDEIEVTVPQPIVIHRRDGSSTALGYKEDEDV